MSYGVLMLSSDVKSRSVARPRSVEPSIIWRALVGQVHMAGHLPCRTKMPMVVAALARSRRSTTPARKADFDASTVSVVSDSTRKGVSTRHTSPAVTLPCALDMWPRRMPYVAVTLATARSASATACVSSRHTSPCRGESSKWADAPNAVQLIPFQGAEPCNAARFESSRKSTDLGKISRMDGWPRSSTPCRI